MRIQVNFQSQGSYSYSLQYHHKLQGFIYNLLRNTPYGLLHDKKGYKFFCFSNILPPTDIKEGETRTLLISSPDFNLVKTLQERLIRLKEESEKIGIGDFFFKVKSVSTIEPKIKKDVSLITGTPILIRIPKRNYEKYAIDSRYGYVFWRSKWPFEAFVKQLEENLVKKFILFNKLSKEEAKSFEERSMPLFQQFIFKKEVCNHLIFEGKEEKVFGSIWQFHFQNLNTEQQRLLQFGLDSGLGEKNSFGFGFMNIDHSGISNHVQKGASPEGTAGQPG